LPKKASKIPKVKNIAPPADAVQYVVLYQRDQLLSRHKSRLEKSERKYFKISDSNSKKFENRVDFEHSSPVIPQPNFKKINAIHQKPESTSLLHHRPVQQ
jgi:hypothetical protein